MIPVNSGVLQSARLHDTWMAKQVWSYFVGDNIQVMNIARDHLSLTDVDWVTVGDSGLRYAYEI